MQTAPSSDSSETEESVEVEAVKPPELCDPCRVMVSRYGKQKQCGWQGASLQPHLKSHKKRDGKVWTLKEYSIKFPTADTGRLPYDTPPAHAQRLLDWQKANPKGAPPPKPTVSRDERIRLRSEELHEMVGRDKAALPFCMQQARDEVFLDDLHTRNEVANAANNYSEMTKLSKLVGEVSQRIQDVSRHLGMTMEQRRKANTLGETKVAQLISRYVAVLRRLTPEKRQLVEEQIDALDAFMRQRVAERILSEVPDALDGEVREEDDGADITDRIIDIGKKAGLS